MDEGAAKGLLRLASWIVGVRGAADAEPALVEVLGTEIEWNTMYGEVRPPDPEAHPTHRTRTPQPGTPNPAVRGEVRACVV
eukprot:7259683-Prymnesium_polylepis.2